MPSDTTTLNKTTNHIDDPIMIKALGTGFDVPVADAHIWQIDHFRDLAWLSSMSLRQVNHFEIHLTPR